MVEESSATAAEGLPPAAPALALGAAATTSATGNGAPTADKVHATFVVV